MTPKEALENIGKLSDLPKVRLVSEREGFLELYQEVTVHANLVPDAHLATLLRQVGVSTLYTNNADDFVKFGFLDVRNPLAA